MKTSAPGQADAWLVIDDYHEIADEPRAEDFVRGSRSGFFRPASDCQPRSTVVDLDEDLLYGDAFEVHPDGARDGQPGSRRGSRGSQRQLSALCLVLLRTVGLRSSGSRRFLCRDRGRTPDQVPESLYRFFADEVFTSLGSDVQARNNDALGCASSLNRELAGALLGTDSANAVVANALDVGILVEREARLDIHPLARAFLKERVRRLGSVPAEGAVETCITHYRLRGEWDAAFDTAASNACVDDLEALMREALAELLDTGRLQTVELWNDVASEMGLSAPIFLLSRGEVALRLGRRIEAMSNAQAAAERDPRLAYRAMSIAGTAAHLASREEDALAFFARAEAAAATESERRDASWGELRCLIDLEDSGAHAALARLSEGISLGQPREFVRAAAHLLYLQTRQGSLDLEHADIAYDVLPGPR